MIATIIEGRWEEETVRGPDGEHERLVLRTDHGTVYADAFSGFVYGVEGTAVFIDSLVAAGFLHRHGSLLVAQA